jgi:catechol 2,3-dioxygenase-like lactoylglutathione lyase family enzyme
MPRGLDHIVHAVADLDAAAEFYRRAGFIVGARNRHPWGTHNHVVQLDGFFIEMLTVAEPEKLGEDGLSRCFGAFNRDAIARHDGFSMLALESGDIDADVADFARSGIGCSPALPFSRQAHMPDGSTATVGFSLAFAHDDLSAHAGFFVSQQHNPQAFWNPAFQAHPNGVTGVAGVVLVADNPTDHHIFLKAFAGVDDLTSTSIGIAAQTPHGGIEIAEAVSFRDQYGVAPKVQGEGATIAGLRMVVADLDAVEALLQRSEIPAHRGLGRLAVPPEAAFGATLIFETAGEG